MKLSALLQGAALLACLLPAANATDTILVFPDNHAVDTYFPTRYASADIGLDASINVNDNNKLRLSAITGERRASATTTLYSAPVYASALNFLEHTVTVSFQNPGLFHNGGGASYSGILGISNNNRADDYLSRTTSLVPGKAIYFNINRQSQTLELVAKSGGDIQVLKHWPKVGYTYKHLSLTLSDRTWSVSGSGPSGSIEGSGTFAQPYDRSNWGSDFYLVIQAAQFSKVPGRQAYVTTGNVVISPGASL